MGGEAQRLRVCDLTRGDDAQRMAAAHKTWLASRLDEAGVPLHGRLDAVLHAWSGEVRAGTRGEALPIVVGDQGVLVLVRGALHLVVDAALEVDLEGSRARATGTTVAMPAVALAPQSQAWFFAPGRDVVELAAQTRVLLAPDGPRPFGPAALSLFRELRYFGGDVPMGERRRRYPARALAVDGLRSPPPPPGKATSGTCRRGHRPRGPGACPKRLPRPATSGCRRVAPASPSRLWVTRLLGPERAADSQPSPSEPAEPGVDVHTFALRASWFARLANQTLTLRARNGGSTPVVIESFTFIAPEDAPSARAGR